MIQGYKKGFTLIELMLAMSFISVLLLSIAMVGIQAGKMYSRGIVLRDVNQAGRDISDTIRRDFLQANAEKIDSTGLRAPNMTAKRDTAPDCRVFLPIRPHNHLKFIYSTELKIAIIFSRSFTGRIPYFTHLARPQRKGQFIQRLP
jgi:prepilin-type N-terminal cleavage/methylation domain-containing protein